MLNQKSFGVFIYTIKTDEIFDCFFFSTEEEALECAIDEPRFLPERNFYIEVWERDANGLYGNNGAPLYKSDE